jgi:hypothetical protein
MQQAQVNMDRPRASLHALLFTSDERQKHGCTSEKLFMLIRISPPELEMGACQEPLLESYPELVAPHKAVQPVVQMLQRRSRHSSD